MDFDKEYKNHKLGLGLNQRAKKSHQEENCNIDSLVPDGFESVVAKYIKALSKEDENFEWSLDKRRVNPDYNFEDQRVEISSPDWIIKSGYYKGEQLKFIVRLIDKEFLERDSIQRHIAKDKDDQMNVTSEWLKRYYEFMHHYDMVIYVIFLAGSNSNYGSFPNDRMMSKEEIEFLSKREHLTFNTGGGKTIVLGATHKNLYDLIRISLNVINREINPSKLDESTNLGLNKRAKDKFDKTDVISNIDYKQVVKNFVMCYAKSTFSHLVDSLNYTLKFIGAKCGDIRSSDGAIPAVWYSSTISNPKDKILIFRLGDWGTSIENPPKKVINSSLLMNRYCFSKAKTKMNIEIDSIVDEFASFVCEVSLKEGYENIIDLLNELRDIVNVYDYSKFKDFISSVNESVTSLGLNKKAKDKFDKEDAIDNMHKIMSLDEVGPMIRHILKENGYKDLRTVIHGLGDGISEFCAAVKETQIKKAFSIIRTSDWLDVIVSLPNVSNYHYNCIEVYFCIHNGHDHVSISSMSIGIPDRIEEEITLGTTKFQPATYSLMAKLIKNIANYKLDNQSISENVSNLGLNKHAQKKFKNADAIDNLELEYVDLGLPSWTRWCMHNYGAISEEEIGERHTFDEAQKLDVDIPSKEDFIELYNNCDYKTEYVNEIYGIRFISKKNEKSIFLPVSSSKNKFIRGDRYWSSTEFSSESGYNLSIDYDLMDPTNYNSKGFKFPVRPVQRVNYSVLKTTNESINLGLNKKAKQKFNDTSSNVQAISNVSDIQEVEEPGSEKFANFILEEGKIYGINEASDEVIRRDELKYLTTNLPITNLRGYSNPNDDTNFNIFVKEKVNIVAFRSSKPFDSNKYTFDPIVIYCILGDKSWTWDEIMLMKIDVDKKDDSKITQVSFGKFSLKYSKKGVDWSDKTTFQNEHSYGPLVPLDLVRISKGIAETNEDGTLKMSMINARLIVKMFVLIFKHINDTVKQKYVDKYGALKQDSDGNYVWVPMTKVKEVSLRERLLACKQSNSNNTFCRLVMDHCWRPGFKKSKVNESNIGLGLNSKAKTKFDKVDTVDNVSQISFEDPEVERICHEHGVYTVDDARQVSSIMINEDTSWFDSSSMKSFNEFKYFTGLTSIENWAFCYCTSLRSINIPNSATGIGKRAFMYCKALKSINIPDSVTIIGDDVFHGCESLQSVNIPNSVTSIGFGSFYECKSLQSIIIPSGVSIIECNVFSGCESLQTINIPHIVTSIKNNAFSECKSLQSITIPNSVTSIGINAFSGCGSLQSIYISKDNPVYDQIEEEYPDIQLVDLSEMNEAHNLGLNKKAKQKHENIDAIDNLSDYVDLSLPSGTLWCKHNLGAEKEYEAGEYLDYNSVMGLDLRPGYMPSKEDFEELVEECTYAWTTVNGVDGILFTSYKNGESVFFPAVGMYTNTGRPQCKSSGFYWSSTLETSAFANNLLIEEGLVSPNNRNFKDYRFSIRLVSA